MRSVRFHPAARDELIHATDWYLDRSETAASGFRHEIQTAIERIAENPARYPITKTNRRRFVLLKYPFDIVYRVLEEEIEIIAISHHARRPEYLKSR